MGKSAVELAQQLIENYSNWSGVLKSSLNSTFNTNASSGVNETVLVIQPVNAPIKEEKLMEGVLLGKNSKCYQFAIQVNFLCFSFGVCCIFISSESGTVSHNNTYLQNPSFPSAYTSTTSISWTVQKCQKGVIKVFQIMIWKATKI